MYSPLSCTLFLYIYILEHYSCSVKIFCTTFLYFYLDRPRL
nr:MAG TPA: hypothetical protein [Caudoviricetes sp.]